MRVQRVSGALGATVDGIDVRGPLSDADIAAIRAALAEHSVLVFRDQDLSVESQRAFAARFGPAFVGPGYPNGWAHIENTAEKLPVTDEWHADSTFSENPPAIGFLGSVVVPAVGGDTLWVSLRAAYSALSPAMQELSHRLRARHVMSGAYLRGYRDTFGPQPTEALEQLSCVHPLVCVDALGTRKALYLSPRYVDSLVGVTKEESDALLRYFNGLLDRPAFQFRWRWQPNQLAMWDERAVNHRGVSDHFLDGPQHRLMVNTMCVGDPPLAAPAGDAHRLRS